MSVCRTMNKALAVFATVAGLVAGLASSPAVQAGNAVNIVPPPGVPQLNARNSSGQFLHSMPTTERAAALDAYHANTILTQSNLHYSGGKIMTPNVQIYAIYWQPAGTTMATNYRTVLNAMLANYAGHAIANINTQYYQIVGSVRTYSSGLGTLAAVYNDTNPLPASGCTTYALSGLPGVAIPGCLTDTQIKNEITRVMGLSGAGKAVWTPGINKIYVLFTPRGVESCYNASNCSYLQYCAYHSSYGTTASPTIYANEPYGEPAYCNSVSASSLPNGGGGFADTAATAARHEVSEASTDPFGDAWFDTSTGEENSDKCAYKYGKNTWDAGLANYMWGGHAFELQAEWSNHTLAGAGGCVQQGP